MPGCQVDARHSAEKKLASGACAATRQKAPITCRNSACAGSSDAQYARNRRALPCPTQLLITCGSPRIGLSTRSSGTATAPASAHEFVATLRDLGSALTGQWWSAPSTHLCGNKHHIRSRLSLLYHYIFWLEAAGRQAVADLLQWLQCFERSGLTMLHVSHNPMLHRGPGHAAQGSSESKQHHSALQQHLMPG